MPDLDPFGRRLAGAAAGLVVVGVVVLIAGGGSTATIAGGLLLAVAAVLGVSLVFYLVGRSEDRDRRDGRI